MARLKDFRSASPANDKLAQIDAALRRPTAFTQLGLPTFPQIAGRAAGTVVSVPLTGGCRDR